MSYILIDLETRLKDTESKVSSSSTVQIQQAIQELAVDLAKLVKKLDGVTGSLPSYDQRLYEERLRSLENDLNALRTSATPKSKFTFRRTAKPSPSPSTLTPGSDSSSTLTSAREATSSTASLTRDSGSVAISTPTSASASISAQSPGTGTTNPTLSLTGKEGQYLDTCSLPLGTLFPPSSQSTTSPSSLTSDVTISDIQGCIINLLPLSQQPETPQLNVSAVHINAVSDSVLLLPLVKGSIMMHNIKNCLIVVGCHQFRMHTSTNVTIYLQIPSTPIIEYCSSLKFGLYPLELVVSTEDRAKVKPFNVQDFSHIRPTPSPNWRMLEEDEGKTKEDWPLTKLNDPDTLKNAIERLLV
ncbi:hypothetical protein AX16_003806 [Volvariella volvacea WC 439]|nr:hypothetical protein AX16_003806 [Volvariella volvacea WC 439]